MLGLDDLFQGHEDLARDIHLGSAAATVLLGLLVSGVLLRHRRRILDGEVPVLAAAIGAGLASAGIDALAGTSTADAGAEDAVKFFAIAFWGAWLALTAFDAVALATRPRS